MLIKAGKISAIFPFLRICRQNVGLASFYGLRDFIQLLLFLRQKFRHHEKLTHDLLLKALERNFGGKDPSTFCIVAETFFKKIYQVYLVSKDFIDQKARRKRCTNSLNPIFRCATPSTGQIEKDKLSLVHYRYTWCMALSAGRNVFAWGGSGSRFWELSATWTVFRNFRLVLVHPRTSSMRTK